MLHQIGVGALGPVFRTYEPIRDRLVAVKVFRLDVTPEQARALADELGRAADAGLFHPSIVEPVAAGVEGTVAYRAEEYVAAESLDVAMRHYAPATVDKVLPFITQLASAIDFARASGVGHGALHPRDVFVTPDEARATGFGVVDALDRLGLRAPVRRPYSPPERIAGVAWGTPADVFSLGVIAFELLTGRRPSGLGADMGSLAGASLGDRSDRIRDVLARAMDPEPAARYAMARSFSGALAEAAEVAETAVQVPAREVEVAPPAEPFVAADEPSLADSPREVARKVIAARKRQGSTAKKKAAPESVPEVAAPLLSESAAVPRVEPEAKPEVSKNVLEGEPPTLEVVPIAAAVIEPEPPTVSPDVAAAIATPAPEPPAPEAALELELARAPADEPVVIPAVIDEAQSEVPDIPVRAAMLEAVELTPSFRDLSDRIVAVDEFRAREAASPKPERTWPRASERPSFDKLPLERSLLDTNDRAESTISPDRIEADLPPSFDDLADDRRRPVMLPIALAFGLGLVLGYGGGTFRASRGMEAPAPAPAAVADVRPKSNEAQAPTTGSTPARETTVVVPPAPNVPPEGAAPSPAPASTPAPPPRTAVPAPRAVRPVPATGRLVITSRPAKAGVTINGTWSGRTPLTLDDLAFGKYQVRIVEPGYVVAQQQVALSATASSRTVDVALKPSKESRGVPPPAAGKGRLFVDSLPRGATVFVDGKAVGVTPLTLSAQAVGPRAIRLELADHRSWTRTATVVAGEVARVTGSLDRIR